jgi:hypothetical protein
LISDEIIEAVHFPEVQDTFDKSTTERKQMELDKILAGKKPHKAIL